MAAEQMNISVSPRMARFIREKVTTGEYTDASAVVADAVRRMRDTESARREEVLLASFEAGLSEKERASIGTRRMMPMG
jgi:putative addiction module CopG family antidote